MFLASIQRVDGAPPAGLSGRSGSSVTSGDGARGSWSSRPQVGGIRTSNTEHLTSNIEGRRARGVSRDWKYFCRIFQGLERTTPDFSKAWKNGRENFQGLETWMAGCRKGGARRVGDPAYSRALSFSVGRVSDSAALRWWVYRVGAQSCCAHCAPSAERTGAASLRPYQKKISHA
jgi:hypothetical protein